MTGAKALYAGPYEREQLLAFEHLVAGQMQHVRV